MHFVAKGYSQVQGVDYDKTYVPVTQLASLQTMLAVAAHNDWDIEVFDFHSVFLNGKLDEGENLYMELPPSYKVKGSFKHPVTKLRIALYGLKQGALRWYLELCTTLNALRLKCSHLDWGIFYTHIRQDILVLMSHIDDCGPVSWLLGMKVIRDRIT